MKGAIALFAASAALANAAATPAQIEARASGTSSGSVPTVTVKGNGTFTSSAYSAIARRKITCSRVFKKKPGH